MAVGDDAVAAGMAILTGAEMANTLDTHINQTRDYIAQRTAAVTTVAKGGTGATTAAAARTNLGVPAVANVVDNLSAGTNDIGLRWSGSRTVVRVDATDAQTLADTNDLNNLSNSINAVDGAKVNRGGDTITGNLFLPNSTAATSGWTVCYINADGRVSRGSSSERYKKFVSEQDPSDLGDLFAAPWVRYQMRSDGIMPPDGKWHHGYIAESLIGTDMEPFVVVIDGVVESIDFIGLLMAQNAQLHQRVLGLEARLTALEAAHG